MLASKSGVLRLAVPQVQVRSTVGAGDSFLAAFVLRLAQGRTPGGGAPGRRRRRKRHGDDAGHRTLPPRATSNGWRPNSPREASGRGAADSEGPGPATLAAAAAGHLQRRGCSGRAAPIACPGHCRGPTRPPCTWMAPSAKVSRVEFCAEDVCSVRADGPVRVPEILVSPGIRASAVRPPCRTPPCRHAPCRTPRRRQHPDRFRPRTAGARRAGSVCAAIQPLHGGARSMTGAWKVSLHDAPRRRRRVTAYARPTACVLAQREVEHGLDPGGRQRSVRRPVDGWPSPAGRLRDHGSASSSAVSIGCGVYWAAGTMVCCPGQEPRTLLHGVLLRRSDPQPVGGFDRDLPGNVVAAEGLVRRQPGGGVGGALVLVGGAVDGDQVQRIVRQVLALPGVSCWAPFCQASPSATTWSICTALLLPGPLRKVMAARCRVPGRFRRPPGRDLR